jgi:peptidylprolyl isomerase
MIESGTKVKVHYKGTLDDGSVFDSSENRDPLEFQLGSGQVIPGLDNAIQEMEVGATKTITIPCNQAYGERREEMVLNLSHDQFPEGMQPEVGKSLKLSTPQGPLIAQITEITDENVVIDANHPLAGKDLTFELTLVELPS